MLTMLADFRTEPYILDKREWDNCQLSAIFEIHVLLYMYFLKPSNIRLSPNSAHIAGALSRRSHFQL